MIPRRLDKIEEARRRAARDHYRLQHPNLPDSDIGRLAELLAATPIRQIAETALCLLPEEQANALLSRYEAPLGLVGR